MFFYVSEILFPAYNVTVNFRKAVTAINDQIAKGKLRIKVSTGFGAIPIEGAQVFIAPFDKTTSTSDDTYSLRTDADGLTSDIELTAPTKSFSLSPGSIELPFSEYVITVKKEGFKTAELNGTPIFDGVTSIQNVSLVPLSEDEVLYGRYDGQIYYENGGYEDLRGKVSQISEEEI